MLDIQKFAMQTNDGTIIACSPMVVAAFQMPSRIVIRDREGEFVVHMQVFDFNAKTQQTVPFYTHGNYYSKERPNALAMAWRSFEDRYRCLACMPNAINHRINTNKHTC